MAGKPEDDTYSDEEAAKRRDATVRAMIATPPKPHKPASNGKTRAPSKARASDRKARS